MFKTGVHIEQMLQCVLSLTDNILAWVEKYQDLLKQLRKEK